MWQPLVSPQLSNKQYPITGRLTLSRMPTELVSVNPVRDNLEGSIIVRREILCKIFGVKDHEVYVSNFSVEVEFLVQRIDEARHRIVIVRRKTWEGVHHVDNRQSFLVGGPNALFRKERSGTDDQSNVRMSIEHLPPGFI